MGSSLLELGNWSRKCCKGTTWASARSIEDDTVTGHAHPQRLLLWVDAVGGYLLALDDVVELGQPSPSRPIALPILADLSSRHAVLRRDGGAYVVEPVHRTLVNGRELTGPTVLLPGQLLQLGESVQLRFTKPHALSSTGRLTIESRHKTQPRVDAVLLMADSCILGPQPHSHIRCRDWQHDVILYRHGGGLKCRAASSLTVNGQRCDGQITVPMASRVEGEDFSFCVEPIPS
jgi:hypothetical protein